MDHGNGMAVSGSRAGGVSGSRVVRVNIRRQDGPRAGSRVESFDVEVEPGANVISVLQTIASNPVTVDGRRSTPPAYDSGCLEEVCGSCTMLINGKVRQACSALMDRYCPGAGDSIDLAPMTKFPVLRDLSVDRARLFEALKRVRAWVPIDGTYDLGAGPRETTERQETRYVLSTCMSCACCLEACPQFTLEPDESAWSTSFVGAALLSQARYFNMHETGAALAKVRLTELSKPGGVSDCGNAQNCVRVCPKEIPLTESIAQIGRDVTAHGLKQYFAGR